LRSISAAADLGINKDDIQKLRSKKPSELKEATRSAGAGLRLAMAFLKHDLSIWDYSYLPYGMQLTHLAEFFRLRPKADASSVAELIRWFWYTSATRYFGGANTGQNSKDLALMRSFAYGEVDTLFSPDEIDISQLLYDRFNLRNATSTTFTLLLNSLNPASTIDGRPLDGAHLLEKSSKYFRSLSPSAGGVDKLNLSKIIYPYSDAVGPIHSMEALDLEHHLLDGIVVDRLVAGDAIGYAAARAVVVQSRVSKLTGCSVKFDPLGRIDQNWETDVDDPITEV